MSYSFSIKIFHSVNLLPDILFSDAIVNEIVLISLFSYLLVYINATNFIYEFLYSTTFLNYLCQKCFDKVFQMFYI